MCRALLLLFFLLWHLPWGPLWLEFSPWCTTKQRSLLGVCFRTVKCSARSFRSFVFDSTSDRVRYLIHLYLLLYQNWPCYRKVPLYSHNPCLMVFLLIGQTKWKVILRIRRLFTAEIIELGICYQADLPLVAVWLWVGSFTSLNFVFFPIYKVEI